MLWRDVLDRIDGDSGVIVDPVWEAHGMRAGRLARHLGAAVGLDGRQLERLVIAASLHDIGKTIIAPAVVHKPSPLAEAEWLLIKDHPLHGYRAVTGHVHEDIAMVVLTHHERFDGKGYPHGLQGEEIPLAARILSVVDAFDAIVTDRVYRSARPVEAALAELASGAGTQFDAEIVWAFTSLVESDRLAVV